MRKFYSLLFVLLAVPMMLAAESLNCFVVTLANNQQVFYPLNEKPVLTMKDGVFTLTTTETQASYDFSNVKEFTFGALADNISSTVISRFEQREGVFVFTGCKAGASISIYDLQGHLVASQQAGNDGCVQVLVAHLPAGVYAVKSDNVSIKILKR
jgi:hypothetical protein